MKKSKIKYLILLVMMLFISLFSNNIYAAANECDIQDDDFQTDATLAFYAKNNPNTFVTMSYKKLLGKTMDLNVSSSTNAATISYKSASCIDNRHNTIVSADVCYRILNIIDIGATNGGRSLQIYKYKKGLVTNATKKGNKAILAGARSAVYMDEIFNYSSSDNKYYKDMLINVLNVIQSKYSTSFYAGIKVASRPSDTKHSYYSKINSVRSKAGRITASSYADKVNNKKLSTKGTEIEQSTDTTTITPVYKTVKTTTGKGKNKKTVAKTVLDYYLIGPLSATWDKGTLSTSLKVGGKTVSSGNYYICNSKGTKKSLSKFKEGKNFYVRYETGGKEVASNTNVTFTIKQSLEFNGLRARMVLLGTYDKKTKKSTHNHQNLGIFAVTSTSGESAKVQWQVNSTNELQIEKLGSDGNAVSNVVFELYCNDSLVGEYTTGYNYDTIGSSSTTGTKGKIVIKNVSPGEYYVKEISVNGESAYSAKLQGYPTSEKYQVSASDSDPITISMTNEQRTNLRIHKTVKNNPNIGIQNATFKVQYSEDNSNWLWLSKYDENEWEQLETRTDTSDNESDAITFSTDANGNKYLESLPLGYYRIVEISVPEPYTVKPQTLIGTDANGNYVYKLWSNNTSESIYCGAISDNDYANNTEYKFAFECADPQIIKISGYVFTPSKTGKSESSIDTHNSQYQPYSTSTEQGGTINEDGYKVVSNATIKLLRDGNLYEASSDAETAGVLTTDDKGWYEYVIEMGTYDPNVGESSYVNRFSVQFVYDGIDFIAMSPNYNDTTAPTTELKQGATSKATESTDSDVRKAYSAITGVESPEDPSTSDKGYGINGTTKDNLTYTWQEGEGNEGRTGTSISKVSEYQTGYDEEVGRNYIKVSANDKDGDNIKNKVTATFTLDGTGKTDGYGNTYNYENYSEMPGGHVSKVTQINIGLIKREKPDMSLVNSLESVSTEINGFSNVYKNSRSRTQNSTVGVTFVADSQLGNFTVYKSDARTVSENADSDKKLKLYATYRIEIVNNAQTLYAKANELALFYDSQYTITSIGTELNDDSKANGDLNGKISSESAIRSTRSVEGQYNVAYVNTSDFILKPGDERVDGENVKYIYVTYRVSDEEIIKMVSDQTNSYTPKFKDIAEINSYTTYEDEAGTQIYAGIDKDSAPGNVPDDINLDGDETRETMTPQFDDDTGYAEEFTISLKEDRVIEGQIFLDESNGGTGQERTSDGIYNSDTDYAIEGVTVELQEVKFNEDGTLQVTSGVPEVVSNEESLNYDGENYKVEIQTTAQNSELGLPMGSYRITGFVPGYYVIKYQYDNKCYYLDTNGNQININALDYKSATISNANKEAHGGDYTTSSKNGNVTWYLSDNANETDTILGDKISASIEEQQSTLREDAADTTKYTKYTEVIDNWTTRQAYDRSKITIETSEQEYLIDSIMDAYTPVFAVNVELNTLSSGNQYVPVGYNIFNMDFGITERAKQELEMDKEVSNVKITLANGQVLLDGNPKTDKNMSGLKYIAPSTLSPKGTVNIELDSELIHGSTLEITYKLTVKNTGEKDYYNETYYKYGTEGGDLSNEVKITPEVYDYVDNRLTFDKDVNADWTVITKNDIKDGDIELVSNDANIGTINTILYYEGEAYKQIAAGETKSTNLVLSRVLSNSNDDDLTYDNDTETVWGNKNGGRRFNIQVGKYMEGSGSGIGASSETTTITPPTGEDKEYTAYIIEGVGALLILAAGIVIIKKKVLK